MQKGNVRVNQKIKMNLKNNHHLIFLAVFLIAVLGLSNFTLNDLSITGMPTAEVGTPNLIIPNNIDLVIQEQKEVKCPIILSCVNCCPECDYSDYYNCIKKAFEGTKGCGSSESCGLSHDSISSKINDCIKQHNDNSPNNCKISLSANDACITLTPETPVNIDKCKPPYDYSKPNTQQSGATKYSSRFTCKESGTITITGESYRENNKDKCDWKVEGC